MKLQAQLSILAVLGLASYVAGQGPGNCMMWNPGAGGNCPDLTYPTSGCDSNVQVMPPSSAVVAQATHASPEMSQAPVAGCPHTTANTTRCQVSIKMVSEGVVSGESNYQGFRLKNADDYNAVGGLVCGCNVALDADSFTFELHLTGSATPGNRNDPNTAIDYTLLYWDVSIPGLRPIDIIPPSTNPPLPARAEVTLLRGANQQCSSETPPGFSLYLYSRGDNDDGTATWEDAIVTINSAWYNGNPANTMSVGWSDVARFIIEEQAP